MINNNLCVLFHDPLSIHWFSNTLDTLSKFYNFISTEQLKKFYDGEINLKNCCHITFDDGYQSVYNYAYPVLKKKGIPATLFVSPKRIEKQENYWFQVIEQIPESELEKIAHEHFPQYRDQNLKKYDIFNLLKTTSFATIEKITQQLKESKNEIKNLNMSLGNLKELNSSGVFKIGGHTINHPILKNETEEKSNFEISASIRQLGELLDQQIEYFAFPNGIPQFDFTEREFKFLEDNNIKLSFTTEHRFIKRSDHKYKIPRINIANGGATKIIIKSTILPYFQSHLLNAIPSSEQNQRKKLIIAK